MFDNHTLNWLALFLTPPCSLRELGVWEGTTLSSQVSDREWFEFIGSSEWLVLGITVRTVPVYSQSVLEKRLPFSVLESKASWRKAQYTAPGATTNQILAPRNHPGNQNAFGVPRPRLSFSNKTSKVFVSVLFVAHLLTKTQRTFTAQDEYLLQLPMSTLWTVNARTQAGHHFFLSASTVHQERGRAGSCTTSGQGQL